MLESILFITKKKKENTKLAVYVNQRRFRSTRGLAHNGDFYFNTGSLDGNEMIRQFIDVVISYEIIGVIIFGIVSDSGGGNEKFFKLLRDNLPISGSGNAINCFQCKNLVDPSRVIYF